MINLRQTTDLRAIRPDVSFAVPKVGIGLHFYYTSDSNGLTSNKVTLYSDHISGNCYVPVTNGSGDNLTVEFAPGESGMTLDLTGTGAGKLDAGTATQGNFYDIRVISKRGSSPALLAHLSGRQEPDSWYMMESVTAENPTTINVAGAHSVQTGDSVTIYGSDISGLNGTFTATRTGDTTFQVPYDNGGGSTNPGSNAVFSGGTFTLPSGYTHYSDVVFGVSYTAASLATFTFSGVPTDGSTISIIDNGTYGSPTTKVFEFDDDASGVSGSNVAVNPAGSGSTSGADAATALVSAINGVGSYGITAVNWGGGKVVLYQDSDSAYPGSGTGVTSITLNDSAHWNSKTSVNVPSSFSAGGIKPFTQVGPGRIKYNDSSASYQTPGLNLLWAGSATASTAVDLSRVCPSPLANTSYESRGVAIVYCRGHNNSATSRNGYLYYSSDGRTDADSNDEDSLNIMFQWQKLDNGAGEGGRDQTETLFFPLKVSATTTAAGFMATSVGTLANIFQYKWEGLASCQCYVWVAGWDLNG